MVRNVIVVASLVAMVLATASDAEAGRRRRRCCRVNYGSCCPAPTCAAPCGPSCAAPYGHGHGGCDQGACGYGQGACGYTQGAYGHTHGTAYGPNCPTGGCATTPGTYSDSAPQDAPEPPEAPEPSAE